MKLPMPMKKVITPGSRHFRHCLTALLIVSAAPSLGGGGRVVQSRVTAIAGGEYNASLTDRRAPEDKNGPVITEGPSAETHALVNEGGVFAETGAAVVSGKLINATRLRPSPSVNLGSTSYGRSSAEFYDGLIFFAVAHDVRTARAVVRLQGSVSFSLERGVTGEATVALAALIAINADATPQAAYQKKWTHRALPPSQIVPYERVDISRPFRMVDDPPNLLQIQLSPTTYTIRMNLESEMVCATGFDAAGHALAGNAELSFGAGRDPTPSRVGPRGGVSETMECGTAGPREAGATIAGLQFLDAEGNVLELAPGDVIFASESGLDYPILGPALPWLSGSDDFDDNQKDTEQWGGLTGTGALEEVNFSLEYRAGAGSHTAAWPVKSNKAPLTESWEVQTDTHWEPMSFSTPGDEASIGIRVSTGTHSAAVRMERSHKDGASRQLFRALADDANALPEATAPAPGTDGAVRLSYSAQSREISYWYDANGPAGGYSWTLLHKTQVGPAGWSLPQNSLLSVEIGGRSNGPAVPPATAWLDYFSASSWKPVTAQLDEVRRDQQNVTLTGCAEPGASVLLQASDDLASWSDLTPLIASPAGLLNYTTPHGGNPHHFFRLRY